MPRLIPKSDDRLMPDDGVDSETTVGRAKQRKALRTRLREARVSRERTAAAKATAALRRVGPDAHPNAG